jgi:tetratricopeptide (TPR) repeat protein
VASAAQKNQGRVPLAPGEPLGVSLARDLRLAGHGLYLAREFRRALVNYEAALGHFSREEEPLLWASLQVDVSDARTAAALLPPTANTPRQLAQAHQDLARALEVLSAEAQPLEWARAQAHQCALLRRVGELGHGDTLPQAARACRQALTVYTREHHPERWARTQAQLAHALFLHARSVRPEELRPLLTQSAEAFHQALTVLTREHQPQEWTAAQMHLGLALMNKDSPDMPDRASLGQAAEAYRQVLTTLSRERRPLEWAGVQAGLGVALYLQAERTPGEEGLPLLEQSIEAQRRALSVHGPAQQWDESCEALGLALGARAARTSRPLAVQPEDVSAHVLDIASALMGCSAKTVGGRLDALRAAIAARPPGPLGTRELDSLECVLGADPRWTASRDWLGALIRGLRASERDKVLTGIDEARARLPPLTPP